MSPPPRYNGRIPWYLYLILLWPRRIRANLQEMVSGTRRVPHPNLWQLALGVLRMWHRLIFRSETIGMCTSAPVRKNRRARLLQYRPLRFPFLCWERSIAPLDLSGLASRPDRLIRHLLGTHHDGNQFVYDFQLLASYDGKLEELRQQARRVVEQDDRRSRWLRDLCVYEGYHESLLAAVEEALERGFGSFDHENANPDLFFPAYLAWCVAQPPTPRETWAAYRAGRFSLGPVDPVRPC